MGKPLKEGLGHFDLWLSNKILPTVDFWHELGFTPNDLTTFGVGTSALALYFMYTGNFHGVLPFALLRWYFDYADGILARKYDQVTVFGDWYDHMNDLVFVTTIFIIFLLKSKAYPFVSAGLFPDLPRLQHDTDRLHRERKRRRASKTRGSCGRLHA